MAFGWFLLGNCVILAAIASTIVIGHVLHLFRDPRDNESLKALEKRVSEDRHDVERAIVNLTARLAQLERDADRQPQGDQIPSDREIVGAVEGMGQD